MPKRIVIIDGHPDARTGRIVHAFAGIYAEAARAAGHEVLRIDICTLKFPLLQTKDDFEKGEAPAPIRDCQKSVAWADHLVILYPLWLGGMPGILKSFFEQLLRPGFAFAAARGKGLPAKLLRGKSARIVVTMGMPGLFYRLYYRSHSLKSLERNILAFCGVSPVRATLVGMVEALDEKKKKALFAKLAALGRQGR